MKKTEKKLRASLWLAVWVGLLAVCVSAPCRAVCQWTRQYGMPCSGCHSTYPRLNAAGLRFRENGYRWTRGEVANWDPKTLANAFGPTWSPTLTLAGGAGARVAPKEFKIHIGGGVGRWGAFLVQPTPGGTADFNMAQLMLIGGTPRNTVRFVGGRVYAWANGGGSGGSDRFPTATLPAMLSTQHGITMGGLGSGARLEWTHAGQTGLALFASDMTATDRKSPVLGLSLSQRLDRRSASYLELFAAQGTVSIPGSPDARADRIGLLFNRQFLDKQGDERINLLTGIGMGHESRSVGAGLPQSFVSGFWEADWSPRSGLTCLIRQDWQSGATGRGTTTGFTFGTALNLSRNVRLDNDLILPRAGSPNPKLTTRLRFVY